MLKDIVGNQIIKNHFLTAIKNNKVSHAYIFEGDKGSGKKLLAENYIRMLQCENPDASGEACGKCQSCIQMDHKDHPDVIWVSHEKPNTISVKDAREQIVNSVDVKPYKGPYKIYVVDEAEKMNPQAQNAILKTIEEPPAYSIVMLLTANRGAFLPTILSRCVLLDVKPVEQKRVKHYLEEVYKIPEEQADFFSRFSMGNIGKAINLSGSEGFVELKNHAIDLLKHIYELNIYELADKVKDFKDWKNEIGDYFDIMVMWYRDLLLLKSCDDKKSLIFLNEYDSLRRQCDKLEYMGINAIFEEIDLARSRLFSNVNFETVIEVLLIKIHNMYQPD